MVPPSEHQTREKFAQLYLHMMQTSDAPAKLSKKHEWDLFIKRELAQGLLPPAAAAWKCPRSINAVLQQPPALEAVLGILVEAGEPLHAYDVARLARIPGKQSADLLHELVRLERVSVVGDPNDLMCQFEPRVHAKPFRASFLPSTGGDPRN